MYTVTSQGGAARPAVSPIGSLQKRAVSAVRSGRMVPLRCEKGSGTSVEDHYRLESIASGWLMVLRQVSIKASGIKSDPSRF